MYHYKRDQVKRSEEGPFSADAILGVLPLTLPPRCSQAAGGKAV